jgi:hypothetical protein
VEEREDLAGLHQLDSQARLGTVAPDSRLGRLGGQLGDELRRGDADGAGELLLLPHGGPDGGRDRGAVPVEPTGPGDVEERLVEGQRLDERRERAEDGHDPPAHLGVVIVVARHEDGVRAEPLRLHRRHGGVDPEHARLVAGRRHHTTGARTAHDHRLAPQLGPAPLLDRRVERVHVDVEDRALADGGHGSARVTTISPGSRPATWNP